MDIWYIREKKHINKQTKNILFFSMFSHQLMRIRKLNAWFQKKEVCQSDIISSPHIHIYEIGCVNVIRVLVHCGYDHTMLSIYRHRRRSIFFILLWFSGISLDSFGVFVHKECNWRIIVFFFLYLSCTRKPYMHLRKKCAVVFHFVVLFSLFITFGSFVFVARIHHPLDIAIEHSTNSTKLFLGFLCSTNHIHARIKFT